MTPPEPDANRPIDPPADPAEPAVRPAIGVRRAYFELFAASFAALFLELACIRWFGGVVVFLTFFTNLVLIACFLGLSIGMLVAPRRRDYLPWTLPTAAIAAALACWVLHLHETGGSIRVDVGGRGSPQQVYFGTEFAARDVGAFAVPIEALAAGFFALIAVTFVGLGQAMGRRFAAIPDRIGAYSVDILGSLAGIAAFAGASAIGLSPHWWFGLAAMVVVALSPSRRALQVVAAVALIALAAASSQGGGPGVATRWSPYYKIRYDPASRMIQTNNIGHQMMISVAKSGQAYHLPHLMNEAAGGAPFAEVLVIGAGSGNDVAAALANGARHVDAVEIDPDLWGLGRRDHPDKPYDDPRVTVHLDDGRSFLRRSKKKYDLIIFALVDSLVLHSGHASSLRLESFLFTEDALRDVRARLAPGGVFAAYNYYRQGWIVGRIDRMAELAFGDRSLVFSLPYQESIRAGDAQLDRITFLLGAPPPSPRLDAIRRALAARGSFWSHADPTLSGGPEAYAPEPPDAGPAWRRIAPAVVDREGIGPIPTDDWPFLYLRSRAVPALNLRGMLVVALAAGALWWLFVPGSGSGFDGRMFFLGAGFMLLETKGVVHMALLFGSTWAVNSIVFAAILTMILLANLYVQAARPRRLGAYYALLAASLLAGAIVPLSTFLGLPATARAVASCASVFVPVFFAGVIFAATFRDRERPDAALGSNIAGVIVGGLAENASLVVGFDGLLYLALGFYALSTVRTGPKKS